MRYLLVPAIGLFLLLTACAPFGGDVTPTPDVAVLETQASALHAVNDAQATFQAGSGELHPATFPPPTQTALAISIATIWGGATVTADAISTNIASIYATTTALVAHPQPYP